MVVLDGALVSTIGDPATLGELSLPRRKIDQISEELSSCGNLTRIELSGNRLSSVEALAPLKNLKWLSVAGNKLSSMKGLEGLRNLAVLNCSRNELTSMDTVVKLTELRAVILNDNNIKSLPALDKLVNLDSLILSQNPISSLGKSLLGLTSLKKLSLSHCEVKDLGTSLINCIALEELRLAHNRLKRFPLELGLNSRLRIIDAGHNNITALKNVKVLKQLESLANLSLRGNPVCEEPQFAENLKSLVPNLQIYDNSLTDNAKAKRGKKSKSKSTVENKTEAPSVKDNEMTDASEARPFLELVAASADAGDTAAAPVQEVKDEPVEEKKRKHAPKQDSKVVSIIEGGDGGRKKRKQQHKPQPTLHLAEALEVPEIGSGGISSWT